jgi:hypothetical protein
MLEAVARLSLLAFGIPGFAPDEHLSGKQTRTTGAIMSNIRQSDVKNHLSPRFRAKIHLCDPVSQPDATGFSGAEPDATAIPSGFAKDFLAEHSSPGAAVVSAGKSAISTEPQTATKSKSAQG